MALTVVVHQAWSVFRGSSASPSYTGTSLVPLSAICRQSSRNLRRWPKVSFSRILSFALTTFHDMSAPALSSSSSPSPPVIPCRKSGRRSASIWSELRPPSSPGLARVSTVSTAAFGPHLASEPRPDRPVRPVGLSGRPRRSRRRAAAAATPRRASQSEVVISEGSSTSAHSPLAATTCEHEVAGGSRSARAGRHGTGGSDGFDALGTHLGVGVLGRVILSPRLVPAQMGVVERHGGTRRVPGRQDVVAPAHHLHVTLEQRRAHPARAGGLRGAASRLGLHVGVEGDRVDDRLEQHLEAHGRGGVNHGGR